MYNVKVYCIRIYKLTIRTFELIRFHRVPHFRQSYGTFFSAVTPRKHALTFYLWLFLCCVRKFRPLTHLYAPGGNCARIPRVLSTLTACQ